MAFALRPTRETLTRKAPFADMQPIQVIWLVGASGQRLPIPEDCPKLFSDIINATWRDDPKERCGAQNMAPVQMGMRLPPRRD